jgi:hypothetical protein
MLFSIMHEILLVQSLDWGPKPHLVWFSLFSFIDGFLLFVLASVSMPCLLVCFTLSMFSLKRAALF